MNRHRPLWSWLFFAHLALVLLATIAATTGHFPTTFFRPPIDKLGHLLAYGGLCFLAVAFFGHRRRWSVIALLLVAATAEEFSQRAFATRTFDVGDLAMNALGICTFGIAAGRRRVEPMATNSSARAKSVS